MAEKKTTPVPESPYEMATVVASIDNRTRDMSTSLVVVGERVTRLEGEVTETLSVKHNVRSLLSFKKWVVGALLVVVSATISFVSYTFATDSVHSEALKARHEDIQRHEAVLKELPRKSDMEGLKSEVSKLSEKFERMDEPPTVYEIEEGLDQLPLKTYEVKALRDILMRAQRRPVPSKER